MNKDNIFVIGGQVKGRSFIGRKALLTEFRRDFLESESRKVVSVVGLSRSGKTSFVKNVFDNQVPDDVFYCYSDLSVCKSYFEIWYKVICELADFIEMQDIPEEQAKHQKLLMKKIQEIASAKEAPDLSNDIEWCRFNALVIAIFKLLARMSIKSILVFDEFDQARNLFILKTPEFALFRTIFSDGDINVFAITISRRKIQTIEGGVKLSSSVSGVTDMRPFVGFSKEDLDEYYQILKNDYGHECTASEKQEIEYYAGNLPYLMAIIGHNIADTLMEGDTKLNIREIFQNKCKTINEYYDACLKSFETEDYLKKIIPITIGPNIGLTKYDIDDFKNIGLIHVSDERYVCISEYFTDYHLTSKLLEISIWDEIKEFEKTLKRLIFIETPGIIQNYNLAQNTVNNTELAVAKNAGISDQSMAPSKKFATINRSTFYQSMTIPITIKIIKGYWEDFFKKYFNNQSVLEFDSFFSKIIKARNGISHGHEDECITDSERNEIDIRCKELTDMIGKKISPITKMPDENTFTRRHYS
ncbi:ATP-binding protein [Succinimonas amylolytica]|uniref:ATP-binding protein n=1 Tax=Succinimonas amylolytica TaxID=83769 RepID=UPI00039CB7D7|nr:ATP-binding protein [Succinimonas amylolytica]